MSEYITAILLLLGSFFLLVAALGILRMPDVFIRMHAATKAGTVGAGLVLLSAIIYFWELKITLRGLATIGFLLLTAPIAAHMIGRTAYFIKVPFWKKMGVDEFKKYLETGWKRENKQVEDNK
ncbi:MAG: monovalent cation/H(+) antiporter subunit G [Deltaproteobacteria bacterium]|nr:monovalent cation/H(+) antiporter subunit G [Deltaproteobacteria bacterium]